MARAQPVLSQRQRKKKDKNSNRPRCSLPHSRLPAHVADQRAAHFSDRLPAERAHGQLAKAKAAGYIVVHLSADQLMVFGGSSDPCALCSLPSIGKIGGSQKQAYSKQVCELLTKHLQIPGDRTDSNHYDTNAADVGSKGSTFSWAPVPLCLGPLAQTPARGGEERRANGMRSSEGREAVSGVENKLGLTLVSMASQLERKAGKAPQPNPPPVRQEEPKAQVQSIGFKVMVNGNDFVLYQDWILLQVNTISIQGIVQMSYINF
ncbi:uncharacterized protein LOC122755292 [Dromiciops gliroides]|uniref:uncharacterized protein LOC122755292 n=1 Tax=Dromiciops gliroides TaxID=33562 RepID=UPI001CC75AE5|nr:uncharacterized protein LOC122755292 [Dromiciops gliroides]